MPSRDPEAQASSDIPREAVLAALDRILASEALGRAKRPAKFLRHLVETALRGDKHLLKETVLGMDVFERPAYWDPRLDPIVRQEAARLRKRLAKYYETAGVTDPVRIELPEGSYVPGFHRSFAPGPRAKPRHVWRYVAGLVALAMVAIAWRMSSRRDVSPSIAVLPFANLAKDSADEYFSDGLTDEVTDSLARLRNLRVIARSSAFQFKGKTIDVREVGRQLSVTHVVEGNVERSGDRVKIIVHLERVSDGSVLWSNTYERQASDLRGSQEAGRSKTSMPRTVSFNRCLSPRSAVSTRWRRNFAGRFARPRASLARIRSSAASTASRGTSELACVSASREGMTTSAPLSLRGFSMRSKPSGICRFRAKCYGSTTPCFLFRRRRSLTLKHLWGVFRCVYQLRR
jgi:TolB-like protein